MTKRIRGICSICNGPRYGATVKEGSTCGTCRKINPPNKIHVDTKIGKREARLKQRYGFEFGEFSAWWIVFRGRCGICNVEMTYPSPTKGQVLTTVCVDHDHETNKVRGLLCNSCNKALGLFKDNPNILNQAINYLGTHGKKISNYSQD